MKSSRATAPVVPAAAPAGPASTVGQRAAAAAFAAVAAGFFAVLWVQYPVSLDLFSAWWDRDAANLVPRFPDVFVTWARNGGALFLVVAGELAAWRAGRRLLRFATGRLAAGLGDALLATGLGNGTLGTLVLGAGLAGLFRPWAFRAAGLAIAAWTAWDARAWRAAAAAWRPAPDPESAPGPDPARTDAPGAVLARLVERTVGLGLALVVVGAACGLVGMLAMLVTAKNGPDRGTVMIAAGATVAAFALWGLGWSRAEGRPWFRTAAAAGLAGFLGLLVVTDVVPAFEPEWFYDSLVYHLGVPEQWWLAGKVCALPHTFFSNFPFLQEMRYTAFLGLGDDVAPKLQHTADGLLATAAVWALARTLVGPLGATFAAAIFASQPTLRFLAHITMVELGLTWFEVLATLAVFRSLRWDRAGASAPPAAWLLVAGWCLGFAQGTKYLGLFASALALGSWTLARLQRGARPAGLAAPLLAAIGWASLWTGPWLAKNWLLTGDPVFPMFQAVFPAIHWDAGRYAAWMHDNVKYGTGHGGLTAWLTMPVMASVDVSRFGTFTLNPAPLLFLGLLLFPLGTPGPVRMLAGYAGLYFLLWAGSSQQTRFLVPMAAQAAPAIAWAAARAGRNSRPLRAVMAAVASWILLVSAYGQLQNRESNVVLIPYSTGHLDREGLRRVAVSYYEAVTVAGRVMDRHARLLFVGGDESYDTPRRRICDSIYDRSTLGDLAAEAARAPDPADRLASLLARRRVTHLLVHEPRAEEYLERGLFAWPAPARAAFVGLLRTRTRQVFGDGGIRLYALTAAPLPRDEAKTGTPLFLHPPETVARAKALQGRINAFFSQRQMAAALPLCDELVRTVPDVAEAFGDRGYARGMLRREREAIADYEQAVRLGTPGPMVYFNLGVLLERDKRYERALAMYAVAADADPKDTRALERAADLCVQLKRLPEGLRYAERLLALTPTDLDLQDRVERLRAFLAGGASR